MSLLQAFPAITSEEFSEACEALEQRGADRTSGTDWLGINWTGDELLVKQRRYLKDTQAEVENEAGEGHDVEDTMEDGVEDTLIRNEVNRSCCDSFAFGLRSCSTLQNLWKTSL